MDEFKNITRQNIKDKLSGEHLLVNRIISSALFMGPFIFLLVIIFLYQKNISSNLKVVPNTIVDLLVIVFFIFTLFIFAGYLFFPKLFLKKENIIKQLSSPASGLNNTISNNPVIKLIGLDRTLMIIRLAMLEGISLFGLIILFFSVQSNLIYYNNLYWVLVIPLFLLGMVVLSNYISKEKTVTRIEYDILKVISK